MYALNDTVLTLLQEVPNEAPDAGRELAKVLYELGAACEQRAKGIDLANFGGEPAAQTFRSVGTVLHKLAEEVEENGFAE